MRIGNAGWRAHQVFRPAGVMGDEEPPAVLLLHNTALWRLQGRSTTDEGLPWELTHYTI